MKASCVLTLALLTLTTESFAGVEVAGTITQEATLKNSPVTAVAIGANPTAKAAVNLVQGDIKAKGIIQRATLENAPVTALAIGMNAKSEATVNAVRDR